jgi:hypothetical protein
MRSLGISLAFALFLVVLIPVAESAQKGGLAARVAQLEEQVAAMEEILQFVYVEEERINGLAGPHWIIEGANVHVRSGSGDTADGCPPIPSEPGLCQSLTGLGNLIVGYNERRSRGGFPPIRAGSHNLIVGDEHEYRSFGGFVAGAGNAVIGAVASVCGGTANRASGPASSVCGGVGNEAIGERSSVCGGEGNVASGRSSSVSGGSRRSAENDLNWAAGSLFEEN